MYSRYQENLHEYMVKHAIYSGKEGFLHIILLGIIAWASLLQFFLSALFIYAENVPVIAASAASLVFYFCVCLPLVLYKRYFLAGFLFSCEVLLQILFVVWRTGGGGTDFFLLSLILMQTFVPYGGKIVRGVFTAVLFVCAVFIPLAGFTWTPGSELPRNINLLLHLFCVCAGSLSVILGMHCGNIVRNSTVFFSPEQMENFEYQAHTDQLTGLFNRRYAEIVFENFRRSYRERNINHCVAMLDIDNFKNINDSFGHHVGDEVLVFLSNFLKNSLRKDDIVFRWGGEEFLVILEGTGREMGSQILDKTRLLLSNTPIPASVGELNITVTIGIADLMLSDVQASIVAADTRMYSGKQSGKNKVVAI